MMIGQLFPENLTIPPRANRLNIKIPFFYTLTNRDKILRCGPQPTNADPE